MPFSIIPFALLVVPIAEIATFIVVGQRIGLLPTLALILVTAIIGSILLRVQGFGIVRRIRVETDEGRLPGRQLAHGAMILVAGVLLLTPGFITDTLGLVLFVPAIREAGWRLLKERIVTIAVSRSGPAPRPQRDPATGKPVIDLGEEDFRREPDRNSPWSSDER